MPADRGASRRAAPVAAAILSISLLALSLPSLVAALSERAARAVLWDERAGERLPPATLAKAGRNLRRSRDGETLSDAGYLLLSAGLAGAEAESATRDGLGRAPANASGWARLSLLREQAGDLPGAAAALRLSLLAGPVVPALTRSRLELAFRLVPAMDADTAELLDRQIRIAWILTPVAVAALADDGIHGERIKGALGALSAHDLEQYRRLHRS